MDTDIRFAFLEKISLAFFFVFVDLSLCYDIIAIKCMGTKAFKNGHFIF